MPVEEVEMVDRGERGRRPNESYSKPKQCLIVGSARSGPGFQYGAEAWIHGLWCRWHGRVAIGVVDYSGEGSRQRNAGQGCMGAEI